MALRFIDGFDHYSFSQINRKWTALPSAYYGTFEITAGRTGNCLRFGRGCYAIKTFDNQATWLIGFALKVGGYAGSTATILGLNDGATRHLSLRINVPAKTISIVRGDGTILATSTKTVEVGVWNYFELKVTIADGTAGSYELRANGSSVGWIPQANGDTRNGVGAYVNSFLVGCSDTPVLSSVDGYVDDLYIADGQPGFIDFVGDVKVETLYPQSEGTYSQFTGQDGDSVNNFDNVNETSSDDDVSYNLSGTVGHRDTYRFQPSSASGAIKGVQISGVVRKNNPGTRTISLTCISGETTDDTSTYGVGDTYHNFVKLHANNPNGDVVWTLDTLNGCEFGIKVVS